MNFGLEIEGRIGENSLFSKENHNQFPGIATLFEFQYYILFFFFIQYSNKLPLVILS